MVPRFITGSEFGERRFDEQKTCFFLGQDAHFVTEQHRCMQALTYPIPLT
jgi:hypothetical protein